jgi:polyisoprenoid-binding protein YceI
MRSRFIPVIAVMASFVLAGIAQAADDYKVDPVHSAVLFKNKHMNAGYVWGRFNKLSGSFSLSAKAEEVKIDITVDAASVDTGNPGRDGHLKKPDFLDAAQFPTITFKSTKVSPGKETDTYEVVGDLTLHGVTKSITVTLKKTGVGENPKDKTPVAGVETAFTVKRSDYGMTQNIPGSADEVTLFVNLEGGKQ